MGSGVGVEFEVAAEVEDDDWVTVGVGVGVGGFDLTMHASLMERAGRGSSRPLNTFCMGVLASSSHARAYTIVVTFGCGKPFCSFKM